MAHGGSSEVEIARGLVEWVIAVFILAAFLVANRCLFAHSTSGPVDILELPVAVFINRATGGGAGVKYAVEGNILVGHVKYGPAHLLVSTCIVAGVAFGFSLTFGREGKALTGSSEVGHVCVLVELEFAD